ncbi:MAG: hypothetical protein IJ532_06965 [Alphaproteobacteria bacterium]|nr:hypothetical protein [Alphaproteobacteria bacterium]
MAKSYLFDTQTKLEIGQALWQARHEKHLYINNVASSTGIPSKIIDGMELGKFMKYGSLRKLMDFYGVQIKITFG